MICSETPHHHVAAGLGMQPRGGHWNAAWKELRGNQIVRMFGDRVELTPLFAKR